jgi:hypothetical protein
MEDAFLDAEPAICVDECDSRYLLADAVGQLNIL